jgi:hypothetical protein
MSSYVHHFGKHRKNYKKLNKINKFGIVHNNAKICIKKLTKHSRPNLWYRVLKINNTVKGAAD